LTYQDRFELRRQVQLLANLTRSIERLARLRRRVSLSREERVSECDKKLKLLRQAPSVIGQSGKKVEPLSELCDRLGYRPPCDRLLACPDPIAHRFLNSATLGAMPRQHFGLRLHDFGELLLQGRSDAAMQLLAAAAQHRVIRSVLY